MHELNNTHARMHTHTHTHTHFLKTKTTDTLKYQIQFTKICILYECLICVKIKILRIVIDLKLINNKNIQYNYNLH